MKKTVLSLFAGLLLMCMSWTASGQKEMDFHRFEVSVSAGGGWVMQDVGGSQNSSYGQPSFVPLTYDLAFMYFPKSWLSVGLAVGNDMQVYYYKKPYYTKMSKMIDITPYVRFHWFRKSTISLYSSIGYSFVLPYIIEKNPEEPARPWYESVQVNPIGLTFGRSLFGFAELGGFSRQVIPPLRLGVGYRF
ncbi:MAG: hypothetical protein IJP81_06065 [Bacteroidales bacterium]|nr:hypothetical protein [Bacteroidales bacterium]